MGTTAALARIDVDSRVVEGATTRSKSGGVHTLTASAEATSSRSMRSDTALAPDSDESPVATMITPPPPPLFGGGLVPSRGGGGPPTRAATAQSLPINGTARIIRMTTRGVRTKPF